MHTLSQMYTLKLHIITKTLKTKKKLLIILYFKTHRKFNLNYSRKQVEVFSL